jgi:hypothetical protein
MVPGPMVSLTQQSSRIRARKTRKAGVKTKRANRASGTPAFPIHPEGYDLKAPDARAVRPAEARAAEVSAPEKKK